jgi:hypothetical protein
MFWTIHHHEACTIKTQTKFVELGCCNMDPYYAVGSCYYLACVLKCYKT